MIRGEQIANLEQDQYAGLTDLMEAELEYYSRCKEILKELRDGWPAGYVKLVSLPWTRSTMTYPSLLCAHDD